MTEQTKLNLSLGSTDFAALRSSNEIYVDKTDMIYQLASVRAKVFLSRPQRFGKSLLVSSFESLFKFGLRDFSGLAIEKLWNDKTYSVVRLDFSEIKDFSDDHDFDRRLEDLLIREFKPAGFVYHEGKGLLTGQISSWLSTLPSASLVLLIDEYDAPLTVCLDNETLFEKIRSSMSSFFQTIKYKEGCLRFFFMTGVTQCQHTCFPEFNFLDDITLNPIFGTLLGYTEDEIHTHFAAYLQNAAQQLKTRESEVLSKLRENYDGFSFEPSAQSHVYCPWSVLNFFKYPSLGYQNYWYASGGQPTVLLKYLRSHDMVNPEFFDSVASITLDELGAIRHINKLSAKALLVQAGYLTIKEQLNDAEVLIGYPNKEVKLALSRMYEDVLTQFEASAVTKRPATVNYPRLKPKACENRPG